MKTETTESVKNVPNEIRISGTPTQNIKTGNPLNANTGVSVHGPNGSTFPNEFINWEVSSQPASNMTAIKTGTQFARIHLPSVQRSYNVTVTATVHNYPNLKATTTFAVNAV
jgi:hypothetical protein